MSCEQTHMSRSALPVRGLWNRPSVVVLALLMGHGIVQAADSTDRSMVFIDKSSQATELFNGNRIEEALAVFQDLLANYADLDEDGYIAMSVGDCLAALGRDEEARAAYRSAMTAHPDLASRLSQRLIELELAGDVTDATIDLLRQASLTPGEGQHAAQWRLGRALQSRAKALLSEAAAAFRGAVEEDVPDAPGSLAFLDRLLTSHADLLMEVADDLGDLIRRADGEWGTVRQPFLKRSCDDAPATEKVVTEKSRGERVVRTQDAQRLEVESRFDEKAGEVRVSVNGKPIKLSRSQRMMIQRHEERINAILLDAFNDTEASRTK